MVEVLPQFSGVLHFFTRMMTMGSMHRAHDLRAIRAELNAGAIDGGC